MTTRDDLAWYENELRRARANNAHEHSVLRAWSEEQAAEHHRKMDRIYTSEFQRIDSEYEARVRWLESEIERLRTATH